MKQAARIKFVFAAALFAGLLATAYGSERGDWKDATRVDSPAVYERFIREHPDSARLGEARQRLEQSRQREETAAWEQVRASGDKSRLMEFIAKYPAGAFLTAAQEQLIAADYQSAVSANNIAAYTAFLAAHGDTAQAAQAREAISRLTMQADESAYALAKKSGRYLELKLYAGKFPTGAHASEVASLLAPYKWTVVKKPKLITWENLSATLLDAAALKKTWEDQNQFGSGMVMSTSLQGSLIQPIERILFVGRSTAIPFIEDSIVEPSTFQIDAGNQYLRLSTPAAGDHIRSFSPFVLVSVGSTIAIARGTAAGVGEARASIAPGPSVQGGSSFSIASEKSVEVGVVNLFGIPCRGGMIRVVEQGFELQPGTEIMLKQ